MRKNAFCDYPPGLSSKQKRDIRRKAYRRAAQARLYALINKLKSAPCKDCGKQYPHYVMHFDHLDGNSKVDNVSTLVGKARIKLTLTEITKCEVVCANCHAERTHRRRFK